MPNAAQVAKADEMRAELDDELLRQEMNKVSLKDAVPTSFDEAAKLLENAGIPLESSSDLITDDYPLIEKDKLVNKLCIFLTWTISKKDSEEFGTPYFVVRGITHDGIRFRFVDGSTGIAAQLYKLTQMRVDSGHPTPNAGLRCENGLTVSQYTTSDAEGKRIQAKTFYIAT